MDNGLEYLILGAGPAGLTVANRLLRRGKRNFLLLEAENEAGGLCRSQQVDGSPLDTGGGHFLDVRRPRVNEFLFEFMPQSEWDEYVRDSRIEIGGELIHHPLEANIWEMNIDKQVAYLRSIAGAGCNCGKKCPKRFVDWIVWKLGDRIAEDYMLPYNRKMFGEQLNRLGTYWLEKLPDVNFEDTLRSCLEHRAHCRQPGHARFYYPKKYGYGELWRRMGKALGASLRCGCKVVEIDFAKRTVRTASGEEFRSKTIVSTIPWRAVRTLTGMPEELRRGVRKLKHTSVQIEYVPEKLDTPAQWIYCPDPGVSYHRILVRHNFCPGSRGYWTETNGARVVSPAGKSFRYLNDYAYPLNTNGKNEFMAELLEWSGSRGVVGLGRWGEHQHYNSDLTVELASELAEGL